MLLGGYGFWAWRRKKASQTKFQDSVLGAATGPGASVFNAGAQPAADTPPPPQVAAADVSEASVSGVSVGGGESDEVDPIAEADVYMAYGRDAQAEEILKEALPRIRAASRCTPSCSRSTPIARTRSRSSRPRSS